jgi:hypothetical protein
MSLDTDFTDLHGLKIKLYITIFPASEYKLKKLSELHNKLIDIKSV